MRILVSTFFLFFTLFLSAQNYDRTCYFGFTYEISNNNSWGYGEPVITRVDPYSNAAKAGLKPGDIIMEVEGKATYLRHYDLIASWIFDNTSREISFTIRNLNNTFKEVKLARYCRSADAITEEELANLYSLYSVEGNNTRHFSLPLKVEADSTVDFTDYYTYDFIFKDKKTSEIDDYIVHQIEKGLNKRGLVRDVNDPDILIQIYYSFQPNSQYAPDPATDGKLGQMRYDVDLQRMELVPVDSAKNGADVSSIKGQVNFGFQFFEKKYLNPGKMTQIWNVELQENITGGTFESYCQEHVPLMIAAYPYQSPTNEIKYAVDFQEYYYTGLVYNRTNLNLIDDVDQDSPAYKAGLRSGDKVLSVNGIVFPKTYFDSKDAYADFVGETMAFRDLSAGFYNDQVKANSYPWYQRSYGKVSKEFKKKRYMAGLSYLFSFEKYVNPKSSGTLAFEVERRGHAYIFYVQPEKRKSANLVNDN